MFLICFLKGDRRLDLFCFPKLLTVWHKCPSKASLSRRIRVLYSDERYCIIYVWKIIEGLVPNFSKPIVCTHSERRGRYCVVSHVNIGRSGTLAYNSFRWRAIRLFNSLPKHNIKFRQIGYTTSQYGQSFFLKTIN